MLICPLPSGPKSILFWVTKEIGNAIEEALAGGDYRRAAWSRWASAAVEKVRSASFCDLKVQITRLVPAGRMANTAPLAVVPATAILKWMNTGDINADILIQEIDAGCPKTDDASCRPRLARPHASR